jgi:quinolinate synthase
MNSVYGGEKTPQELHEHLSQLDSAYTLEACTDFADWIQDIQTLKQQHNAVILAHNYQRPEIFEVADFVGDSLELARKAKEVESDQVVFCGVHFMAETAKIVNPERKILLPDLRAGCSLAESITGEALAERKEELRKAYPDLKTICYINTTADVKAECDACCTSSNAVQIVESLDTEHVLFVPDENLARYVQTQTSKTILSWDGNCYVHHQITPEHVLSVRNNMPNVKVLVHPECREDVINLADAVLSTSAMVKYAKESPAQEFLIVTECGLSDRLLLEMPEKKFYKSCQLCHYMKMITLDGVRDALREQRYEITLPEDIRIAAERAIDRMLELSA